MNKYLLSSVLLTQTLLAQEFNTKIVLLVDVTKNTQEEVQALAQREQLDLISSQNDFHYGDQFKLTGSNEQIKKFISAFTAGKELVSKNQNNLNYGYEIKSLEDKVQYFTKKLVSIQEIRQRTPLKNDSLNKLNPYDVSIVIKDKKGQLVSQYSYTTSIAEKSAQENRSESQFLDNLNKQVLELNDSIYKSQSAMEYYKSQQGISTLELTVKRRLETGFEDDFSFVNMPGASMDYMFMEKPNSAMTAETYQGYKLKYLFSKGKSYFTLGSLSAVHKPADSSAFSDLFMWGMGTDFYPKYLGRGKRTFLNLYTGLEFGGTIYFSEKEAEHYFNVQPKLGLELFKTARILLDVNGAYYVPFSIENNQNLRAYMTSASLNFIF